MIEAGHLIEEAIEEPARPIDPTTVAGPPGLGRWTESAVDLANRRRQRLARNPTPERLARIADLVDEFSHEVSAAANLLPALAVWARVSADWGAHLRNGRLTSSQMYRELKEILGVAQREQTQLTLQRMRDVEPGGI